jgi:hypothetical protein
MTIIATIMLFAGMTLLVYAGPCYVQTTTIYSYELGCYYESAIGPDGRSCPSLRNQYTGNGSKEYACQNGQSSNKLGIGTLGNQRTGKISHGIVSRSCNSHFVCMKTDPYILGLPLQSYFFDCNIDTESIHGGWKKHSSIEPVGENCPCATQ